MSNIIYYEQPLGERIRTFLRLEHLFRHASYTLRGYSVWDSRSTLTNITAVLDILSRSDLKTEMLKELERQQKSLERLTSMAGVDQQQLQDILHQLEQAERNLHTYNGQLGTRLREHELLNSIRQRSTVIGGTCSFDLPALHYWLQQSPESRIEEMEQWLDELSIVQQPINLMLGIIRESSVPHNHLAKEGFYQQNIESSSPVQLIRVGLTEDDHVFPEISAGKQRFSIRFLIPQGNQRPVQTKDDIPFQLSCCAL